MKLQEELIKLRTLMNSGEYDKANEQAEYIRNNFTSQEDIDRIDEFISSGLDKLTQDADSLIKETTVKLQLMEVSEIVSLSYIAKKYFKKTRGWLYQKINGNTKNGKPVKFTPEEVETLNNALQDISKQLGSTVISL
ncbi:DUF5053 domain-containing protein [Dysgonomonas sp. GY75]|uniref:DUF5053 domain-containing protein n=1 Tax=Dysgonomonas sp. GY75 TaxID=2780419 RepID=UPI001883917B|nr:DUF5053 domain-containing protein [Dysgonomonas sp. GY75]MBF0649194.1 DUF5053 domain-containing protein [Dysgonomonas sp. GY75]